MKLKHVFGHILVAVVMAAQVMAINYYCGGEPFKRGPHNELVVLAYACLSPFAHMIYAFNTWGK